MKVAGACIVFIYLFSYVCADVYMQNPRGSNDRLNEGNTDRNNANRLFDSQNNARGGYCYGPALSFYEGSRLSIEWTAQHACRNEKVYCNMVIQYMCGEKDADPMIRIRDGLTTNTITDSPTGPTTTDPNNPGELLYGMHESYQYYQDCKCRKRNLGLWISDRKTEGGLDPNNRPTAIFTRQNNGGNRHGYECAEERDYYPYWAPSPWKDIAILTDDMAYCNFYKSESQNVKGRGYCTLPSTAAAGSQVPNNEGECGQSQGTWTTAPSHGLAAPDCVMAPYSRDNHLGNGNMGYGNSYNWTLPRLGTESCIDKDNCACVLRIRYNISTSDLNNLKSGKTIDGNSPTPEFIDAKSNEGNSPIHNDQISPYAGTPFGFQLAMDTSQYGRTFQDRSHVFRIKPRPSNIDANARIYNLNVRGKRGNIQQTFPGTEYDFVPENLNVHTGDYIHFQWTGCDTNPTGYAGEGTDRWDRSNIVQIEDPAANVPASDDWLSSHDAMFTDLATRQRMAMIDQDPSTCLSWDALLTKNGNNENNAKQDVQNCMKLNAAPTPYFDGGAIQMNTANSFYYMSSRNNNFSNRGHKAVIHVTDFLDAWAIGVVSAGAALFVGGAGIAGATFYAKSHPHSSIANFLSKF